MLKRHSLLATIILLLGFAAVGCSSTQYVSLRKTPKNPLTETLSLVSRGGAKSTERTMQVLRQHNLEQDLKADRTALLAKLSAINLQEPHRDITYAMAELAYVGAKQTSSDENKALELYGAAVMYAYEYLFDESYTLASNPYDPQFRRACDLYNSSLEETLRLIQKRGELKPGTTFKIQTANRQCELSVVLKSEGWSDEDFNHFEFASDYEVDGLKNNHHSYGLGVPLIAFRKKHSGEDLREHFYPDNLTYPVTALVRITPPEYETWPAETTAGSSGKVQRKTAVLKAVLEFHDSITKSDIRIAGHTVPLETDISTPLAYFLNQPEFSDSKLSTLGLLMPEQAEKVTGLYMMQPYDPNKMPVVMVHGLWSSPVTWMEMFNDLQSDPVIRENYQFWFYLYPSGQPFWYSAAQMREELARARLAFDPAKLNPALDQTVLVGHSMGGLVSKLQTVDSGNEFWTELSDKPFSELKADGKTKEALSKTFFFQPNPSISRIITIGTPHRGSTFSNDFTVWLGRKFISIPTRLMEGRQEVVAQNPDYFKNPSPLSASTSIDSLNPSSKFLQKLAATNEGPWVRHHNIVGRVPDKGIFGSLVFKVRGEGDGVVGIESAKQADAASEIIVAADHTSVHRHPASILEVRRVLIEQLNELKSYHARSNNPINTILPAQHTEYPLRPYVRRE